jgi:tetratricopeptide (TPR) repeat protein
MLVVTATLNAGGALAAGGTRPSTAEDRNAQDIAKAERWIKDEKYERAITRLLEVVERDPDNADALNWLGYSYRKTGKLEDSATYYERALTADPDHKGALEYQGELFIMTGQMDKARANLARLEALCPDGCDERAELETAIARGRSSYY